MSVFATVSSRMKSLLGKGFFHIFGANVANKIIAFFTNIAIVWFLTKEAYGVFSYANNIYSIALLFTGFGVLAGMFQLCAEQRSEEERKAIYRYSLLWGACADCVICLTVVFIALFIPLSISEASSYLALFGPLVVLDYVFQYFSIVLRSKKENKKYAALQTANTLTYFCFGCFGAYAGGIVGTIAGRYVAYVVSIALALFQAKRIGFSLFGAGGMSAELRKDLWGYSIPTQVSSSLNQLTFLLDVFLVGVFVADAGNVASYKVATMLPEGLLFIPSSLVVFAMPYFIEKNKDRAWFAARARSLLMGSTAIYAVISMALVVLAPQIIVLLWGADYLDAALSFRLLGICFAFSSVRTTCTNLLCSIRAVRSNLAISVVSLLVNVLLCVALIPRFGIDGAAIAPLAVSIVAAVIAAVLLVRGIAKLPEVGDGK